MTTPSQDRTGMSAAQLRRLAGAALIATLPLQVAGLLMHPPNEELQSVLQGAYGPSHLILFASWVLAMLGLPALYLSQAGRAGRLGLVAFVVTMVATAYHLYLTLYEASAIPVVAGKPGAEPLVGEAGALAHGAGALGPLAGILLLGFPSGRGDAACAGAAACRRLVADRLRADIRGPDARHRCRERREGGPRGHDLDRRHAPDRVAVLGAVHGLRPGRPGADRRHAGGGPGDVRRPRSQRDLSRGAGARRPALPLRSGSLRSAQQHGEA